MTSENENNAALIAHYMPTSLLAVRVKNAEAGVKNVEEYLERALYGRRPMAERGGPLRDRVKHYVTLLTEGLDALDVAEAELRAATEAPGR